MSARTLSELGAWRLLRVPGRWRRLGERLDGSDLLLDEATGETLGIAAPGWPLRVDPVGPLLREAAVAWREQRALEDAGIQPGRSFTEAGGRIVAEP